VGLVAVLVALLAAPAGAQEPADPGAPGAALVEVCTSTPIPALPVLGSAGCKTLDSGAVLLAIVCGQLPVDPAACADLTDGRPVDAAAVDAFAKGWVPRALALQARLDWDRPLRDAFLPHTHNSFNSPQHGPSLTTADPNQRYTLTDQLRMGFRALELDLHWFPHPAGTPADGLHGVVVCHGQTQDVGPLSVHVGCSVDRLLGPVLDEVRAFLDAPGNEHEVLLLYLQNELDDVPAAHAEAVAELERAFGPLLHRPTGASAATCEDLPVERSRADLLAAGHRVLLVGGCGPGPWSSWVFQQGAGWDERANSGGYPDFPACAADRVLRGYDEHLIRVTEDQTWLSAVVGTPAPITVAEVRAMVRCGVELIGLDRVGPDDPRLPALVWSWAPDEPSTAGPCALRGADGRFRAADCSGERAPACRTTDGGWVVPAATGPWADGFATCAAAGAAFAVPTSGWDNEQLGLAAPGGVDLWLDYGVTATGWQPALAHAAEVVAPGGSVGPAPAPPTGPATATELPATGSRPGPTAAAAAVAAAVALLALRAAQLSGRPGRRRP
jgi:hypothetical protein